MLIQQVYISFYTQNIYNIQYLVGDVVLVRCKGSPIWPAKIIQCRFDRIYKVKFFNEKSTAYIELENIETFNKQTKQKLLSLYEKKKHKLNQRAIEAIKMAEMYEINKIDNKINLEKNIMEQATLSKQIDEETQQQFISKTISNGLQDSSFLVEKLDYNWFYQQVKLKKQILQNKSTSLLITLLEDYLQVLSDGMIRDWQFEGQSSFLFLNLQQRQTLQAILNIIDVKQLTNSTIFSKLILFLKTFQYASSEKRNQCYLQYIFLKGKFQVYQSSYQKMTINSTIDPYLRKQTLRKLKSYTL